MQGLQLYPTLRGERKLSGQVPVLFTTDVPAVASNHKVQVMQQMSLLNATNLEQLATSISSHLIEADINTLFHLYASSLRHANKNDWTVLGLILAGVLLTLFTIFYFTRSYIWNLLKTRVVGRGERASDYVQEPQEENPSPSHPHPTNAESVDVTDPTPQVRYSVYSLQSA